MRGERIEVLSALFAAGTASGALLCSTLPLTWLPSCVLSAFFPLLALSAAGSRSRDIRMIMAIYLAGGFFCYLAAYCSSAWETGTMNPISSAAGTFASHLKDRIAGIPYEDSGTAALVTALLTGDRTGISRETGRIFRESGASHILALSGMHLGIIYMLLSWTMVPLGNSPASRKVRSCAIIAITFFYSLATGMSPSITRAFLFVAISETAAICGRRTKPSRVFCAALFLQLAIDPEAIASTGFQLSYLAMCGIILLFPRLEAWYPHERGMKTAERFDFPRRVWQASALGISCQVFTAPLVWLKFHSFPTYFLMTNLLAMPVTTAVMVLSIATVMLSSAGMCPGFLVAANEKTVSILIRILTVISEM